MCLFYGTKIGIVHDFVAAKSYPPSQCEDGLLKRLGVGVNE